LIGDAFGFVIRF